MLATAFVLGTAIGFERQWRQRTAGLRTTVLAAVGPAAFSDPGMRLLGAGGATRIVSHAVSGIGFLGAGVILKDGTPLVNWANRQPISADVTEAQYRVHVTCAPADVSDMQDLVELIAGLVPTTAEAAELDAVVVALEASPLVQPATWTVVTTS